ncbi:MAG: 5-(carboxyamino)imidazole ribonucleotide mutase [Candidatus Aminicenantes bacterium]|nr:5-(carboxyamino)imidazole ribonucleotide mutase [Candidatus Aminicenantes bacterium]MDH5704511.1 5-(carboxyamino)imidazole ribonucleotide mutase [Candidatus Aminicenantes bacterium]
MMVAVFIGSDSDYETAKEALELLKKFGVSFSLEVSSAHRSPERTVELVKSCEEKGVEVFIAVAGKAAHLAGVVAAHTVRPVIGVPVASPTLNGLDALLSTVQMPKGVPVATMGLGKSGAANAALLAVQILSLREPTLRDRLKEYKEKMASQVEDKSKKIKQKI